MYDETNTMVKQSCQTVKQGAFGDFDWSGYFVTVYFETVVFWGTWIFSLVKILGPVR